MFEARDRNEAARCLVKFLAVGIVAGNSLELAVGVIGPAVIHAIKLPRVAFALAADDGAAVAAGIDQRARGALAVAAEDDRPARHVAGAEIAGRADLGRMADIDPALVEDRAIFIVEHGGRDEHFPVDREGHTRTIFNHETAIGVAVLAIRSIGHVQASKSGAALILFIIQQLRPSTLRV